MKTLLLLWLALGAGWGAHAQNNYRYTLYLKMHSIKADRVVEGPFDNEEDLYGKLRGEVSGTGVAVQVGQRTPTVSVSKELRDYHVGRSAEPIDQEVLVGRRLTLDEVGNLKVRLGGEMKDKELAAYFTYELTSANEIDRAFGHTYRAFFLKDIVSFMNALRALLPSSEVKAVRFGRDTFAETEFLEESGPGKGDNDQRSKITVFWQFRVVVSQ